jgi:preprotein translocase subunit SecE
MNPLQWAEAARVFVSEVQVEFRKITWSTRKEVVAGTIAVIVLVALIGLGLFAVDGVLSWAMNWLW